MAMEKINIKSSAPMRALETAKVKFPKFFKMADYLYKNPETKWDKSLCYCPIGLGVTYVIDLANMDNPTHEERREMASQGAALSLLASWRKAKSIYVLDPALEEEFYKTTARDLDVDAGMLTIPEWCIYIKTNLLQDCTGLMVMFDHDLERGKKELYIGAMQESGNLYTNFYMPLPEGKVKLSEIIADERTEFERHPISKEKPYAAALDKYFGVSHRVIRFVCNVLLYLSAINTEVRQVNKLSFRRQGRIKDTPREVAVYSVGEQTGYRIRKINSYVKEHGEPLGGHHRSPVMHVRRAHWHTFAYGPGKSLRRVKWLPPIIVNGDGEEMDIPTITAVKKN